jgi:hypothetical protein
MSFKEHKKMLNEIMYYNVYSYLDGIIKSYRIEKPEDYGYICKLFIELSEKNDIESDKHYNIFKLEMELDLSFDDGTYCYTDDFGNKYDLQDKQAISLLIFQFLLTHIDKLQSTLEKERYLYNKKEENK